MSNAALLKVYDGQEPDLCFGAAPGPGGVNSVGVGAGLVNTGTSANPVVSLGMSAVGDLLVGNGTANSGAVLGKGANGNFLRVKTDGTGLEYAAVAPGGVDSITPIANNVGLVLTTAPATPTDPKIGLAFTAKADIPVGTAASTGVMVSAPLPLTTGLFLQTDTAAASGVKWAPATGPSGAIGTNAPLVDDYDSGTGDNTLSINFSTALGELPYGNGTAKTGALLAPPTGQGAIGKVLTFTGPPTGVSWATPPTPVGGDIIILHSQQADTLIPSPTDKDEQLILVADEQQAAWDKVPPPTGLPATYTPELRFTLPTPIGGASECLCVSYVGPNGLRDIDLWLLSGGGPQATLKVATFQFTTGPQSGENAYIRVATSGLNPNNPSVNFWAGTAYEDRIILGGRFNQVITYLNPTPITLNNICAFYWDTSSPIGEYFWTITDVIESVSGLTNGSGGNVPFVGVNTIAAFPANSLPAFTTLQLEYPGFLVGGNFNAVAGFPAITGLYNMCAFYVGGPSVNPLSYADNLNRGFWIGKGTRLPDNVPCEGSVESIVFTPEYGNFFVCGDVLDTASLAGGGGITPNIYNPPNNNDGFLVFAASFTGTGVITSWDATSEQGGAPFNTIEASYIKYSSALANTLIVMGNQCFFVDTTAGLNQLVYTAIPSAPAAGFPAGLVGFTNSVAVNATINPPSPAPAITGDFLLFLQTGPNGAQYVGYITTATGQTIQPLDPIPTNVPTEPFIGVIFYNYGINYFDGGLHIAGQDAEYVFDPAIHTTIDFTTTPPTLFKIPAGTPNLTKALFSTSYQAQSYIASVDLKYWIQLAPQNPNLSYS
jgi:hypothetical protein